MECNMTTCHEHFEAYQSRAPLSLLCGVGGSPTQPWQMRGSPTQSWPARGTSFLGNSFCLVLKKDQSACHLILLPKRGRLLFACLVRHGIGPPPPPAPARGQIDTLTKKHYFPLCTTYVVCNDAYKLQRGAGEAERVGGLSEPGEHVRDARVTNGSVRTRRQTQRASQDPPAAHHHLHPLGKN